MSAKFTPKIRPFAAASLIDSLKLYELPEWQPLTEYLEGDIVIYESNKYTSKSTGTSGVNPPVHLSGSASDGSIEWIWVDSININQFFKRNLYVFIGKNDEWDDENAPDEVSVTDLSDMTTLDNIISMKRVTQNDCRLAVKRYNWLSGQVYSPYSDVLDPLSPLGPTSYPHPYYVFTEDNNIYKCINNNNGGTSTIKPVGVSPSVTSLADGYVWKYMGSLEASDVYFLSRDFVPVKYKTFDDNSPQWSVQQSATRNSISAFNILKQQGTFGLNPVVDVVTTDTPTIECEAHVSKNLDNTLKQIIVDVPGEGYFTKPEAIVKNAGTSGSGATVASVTVVNGEITNIELGDAGSGYTGGAICIIVDDGGEPTTDATISVDVSPSNTISEINVTDGGSGYSNSGNCRGYIIPGTAGAIASSVMAPKDGHGSNIVTELCANTVIVNTRFDEAEGYLLTGETSDFRQVGLISEVMVYGGTSVADNIYYIGPNHPEYSNGSLNRMNRRSGTLLYVTNIKKVLRSDGQEEEVKIAITF
jgi:hypothetical protein